MTTMMIMMIMNVNDEKGVPSFSENRNLMFMIHVCWWWQQWVKTREKVGAYPWWLPIYGYFILCSFYSFSLIVQFMFLAGGGLWVLLLGDKTFSGQRPTPLKCCSLSSFTFFVPGVLCFLLSLSGFPTDGGLYKVHVFLCNIDFGRVCAPYNLLWWLLCLLIEQHTFAKS